MMPLTECDRCGTTMRPDVGNPHGSRLTEQLTSRVECPNCGRKLGTLHWEMP